MEFHNICAPRALLHEWINLWLDRLLFAPPAYLWHNALDTHSTKTIQWKCSTYFVYASAYHTENTLPWILFSFFASFFFCWWIFFYYYYVWMCEKYLFFYRSTQKRFSHLKKNFFLSLYSRKQNIIFFL